MLGPMLADDGKHAAGLFDERSFPATSPPPLSWRERGAHQALLHQSVKLHDMLNSPAPSKLQEGEDCDVASASASTRSRPTPMSQGASGPISRPTTPAAYDDFDEIGLRMLDDMDLSSLYGDEEPLMTMCLKDEQLLAMLGAMAKTDSRDDDEVSLGVHSLLPEDVQEGDPDAVKLREQCEALRSRIEGQVAANNVIEDKLRAACEQIKIRSERQTEEKTSLVERVQKAKQAMDQKISECQQDRQRLSNALEKTWADCEHYRHEINVTVPRLLNDEKDLNRLAQEEGDLTAVLTKELERAREREAGVLARLQEERVKVFQESTNVVVAFTQGEPQQLVSPRTGCPDPHPGHGSRTQLTPRSLPRDLHARKVSFENQRNSDSERLASLQQVCEEQEQAIVQTREELALLKKSRGVFDKEFVSGLRRAKGATIKPAGTGESDMSGAGAASPRSPAFSPPTGNQQDLASLDELVTEAETLDKTTRESDERYVLLVEDVEEASRILDEQQQEVIVLCERLEQQEALNSDVEEHLYQFRSHCAELESKIRAEQDALDEAQRCEKTNKERLRKDVQRLWQELDHCQSYSQDLRDSIAQGGVGCLRRRQVPKKPAGMRNQPGIVRAPTPATEVMQQLASQGRMKHPPPPPPPFPSGSQHRAENPSRPPPPPTSSQFRDNVAEDPEIGVGW